jgi:hypothetical protein
MRPSVFPHAATESCVDGDIVWRPPVGEWVRIRTDLSDRCPEGSHDGAEPGHTGIVVNVRGACGTTSHPYLVLFDRPHPVMTVLDRPVSLPVRHYALEELEQVPSPA